jgi:hypothetical protein
MVKIYVEHVSAGNDTTLTGDGGVLADLATPDRSQVPSTTDEADLKCGVPDLEDRPCR